MKRILCLLLAALLALGGCAGTAPAPTASEETESAPQSSLTDAQKDAMLSFIRRFEECCQGATLLDEGDAWFFRQYAYCLARDAGENLATAEEARALAERSFGLILTEDAFEAGETFASENVSLDTGIAVTPLSFDGSFEETSKIGMPMVTVTVSRTKDGRPMKDARYCFFPQSEELSPVLEGKYRAGEADFCFLSVENLEPEAPAGSETVSITTVDELLAFAEKVNRGDWQARYDTASLERDLDLAGVDFPMIGTFVSPYYEQDDPRMLPANGFEGTFLGNGHTIRNAAVTHPPVVEDSHCSTGFFSFVGESGRVSDLTLENCTATGPTWDEAYGDSPTGILFGELQGMAQNCHVVGGSATGANSVGGFAGQLRDPQYTGRVTVLGCTVKGTEVEACSTAGVFCGAAHYGTAFASAADGTVTSVGNSSGELPKYFGGFAGFSVGGDFARCLTRARIRTMVNTGCLGNFIGYNQGNVFDCAVLESAAVWDEDADERYPGSTTQVSHLPQAEYDARLAALTQEQPRSFHDWHAAEQEIYADEAGAALELYCGLFTLPGDADGNWSGSYTVVGDRLIAKRNDGAGSYVFAIDGETLAFLAQESSIPNFAQDGAVFTRQ